MNNNPNRVAKLTSSYASLFMLDGNGASGFGAGAITYINKKKRELRWGRGLDLPVNKWEVSWGKLWEVWVHYNLKPNNEYELVIDKTTVHPEYDFWSGSQDFNIKIEGGGIAELKCYQMINHEDYSNCLLKQDVELFKKEFKDEYWQIVSNCCINNAKYGEAIAFMPTLENLLEMRKMVEESNYVEKNMGDDPFKYKFIVDRNVMDLPFVMDGSDIPSQTKFRFEVPIDDKIKLAGRMIKAGKLLNEM